MARKSKWVHVESPQAPVIVVARHAIGDRLQLVWRYMRRATHGAPTDTENVHQLRVSTRRTVAAMEIFESLLPKKRARWMQKQLKHVRRVAGEARDLDVMIDRFLPLAETESTGSYAELVHFLKVRRQRAQEPLDACHERLKGKHFRRRSRALVKRIRYRTKEDRFERPSYLDAAQSALEPEVVNFFRAGEGDFGEYARLHAFRIEGKKLRYAMEVFAAAFPANFREDLYPLVADLQERLGHINDHATAHERFTNWLAEEDFSDTLRPTLEALVSEEREALESSRTEFLNWWTADRRDELQQRFRDALHLDLADQQPEANAHANGQAHSEPAIALRRAE